MKRGSTIFLRAVVLVMGAVVLALCLIWLPLAIYPFNWGGYDPILMGLYVSAIPFFLALHQTLRLLGLIDRNQAFSDLSVKALKNIRNCALTITSLFVLGLPYIFHVADLDDAPGVVAIAFIIIFTSLAVAVFAAVLKKLLGNAIEIKRENELTV